jgi:hypothetical protein
MDSAGSGNPESVQFLHLYCLKLVQCEVQGLKGSRLAYVPHSEDHVWQVLKVVPPLTPFLFGQFFFFLNYNTLILSLKFCLVNAGVGFQTA